MCARARVCPSIVDEEWMPSTGARVGAVNAPFPQCSSARRFYPGSILTVHHLVFNCGKESVRASSMEKSTQRNIHTDREPPRRYLRLQSVAEKDNRTTSPGARVVVVRSFRDTGTRSQTSEAALIPSEKNMMSH